MSDNNGQNPAKLEEKLSLLEQAEQLTDEPEIEPDAGGPTLPVGMKIDDRYEVMDVLGVGGFATVYRAHHLTMDRDVAIKVMDMKKGVDASYSQRFFREAKIAAKFHHNNVVHIYDFGHVKETGQPYIAMEMLHGHDLAHELSKSGPLSPQRAYVLFRPVLDALGQGHRLGIVHKDLKPENLYLVDPGNQHELMKVLDFGVARINSSEVAKLTSAGQLLGTPRYLAPEYIKTQSVSPAIDVYQMALIISEALTGTPAVSGDPFHAMMVHCSGQLQFAPFLLEGPVGEVFRKAISIDPEQRYPDCDAFGAALDGIASYFSSTVPLEGGAPQLTPDARTSSDIFVLPGMPSGQVSQYDLSSVKADPEPPKKNFLLIAIILLILVIGGVVIALMSSKNSGNEQQTIIVQQAPEKEDLDVNFNFESDPAGAKVLRNGKHMVCPSTPCNAVFKESELEVGQYIVFKLNGYEDSDYELKSNTFEKTKGKVKVTLKKVEEAKPDEPTELKFTLTYEPANAKVVDVATKETVCSASPCEIILNMDEGIREVSISANGFTTAKQRFTKNIYNESNGAISVTLDVAKAKPVKTKTEKAPDSVPVHINTKPPAKTIDIL